MKGVHGPGPYFDGLGPRWGSIGNETKECPLGSDTSRFIIFQVRFPSLQLYSRSNVLLNRSLSLL